MDIQFAIDAIRGVLALGLFSYYVRSDFSFLSCFALLAGTNLFFRLVLSWWLRSRHWTAPPAFAHPELTSALQAITCAPMFLPNLDSRAIQLFIVVGALVVAVRGARTAALAAMPAIGLRGFARTVGSESSPALSAPLFLVIGSGVLSARTLNAWLQELTYTLWSTRQQAPSVPPASPQDLESLSGLAKVFEAARQVWSAMASRWLSRRSLVALTPLDYLERLTESERQRVIDHSAGVLAVRTRGRLWLEAFDVSPDDASRLRAEALEMIQANVILRWLSTRSGSPSSNDGQDRFLDSLLHHAAGPVVLLMPEVGGPLAESVDDASRERMRGYELVSAPMRTVSMATPQVTNLIANVALPLHRSQRRLSERERDTARAVGAHGLAPLADAYLRFRLSGSAVERFLCLFDCFEVVIKYSVFALGAGSTPRLQESLTRPSLGIWIALLREQVGHQPALTELGAAVSAFWAASLADRPRELIDLVNGSGMAWPTAIPRSHLGWLDWLVWLRNATRGHGAVEERSSLMIWHDFHATLLDTIRLLEPLTLRTVIHSELTDGTSVPLQGWLRGPFRSSTLDRDPRTLSAGNACPQLGYNGALTPLYPFVRCEGNACLTWNSAREDRAEYIDYGTGRISRPSPIASL